MTKLKRIQNRRTPRRLFNFLDKRFGPFFLDAAAEHHNAMCEQYCTEEHSGLETPWTDVTFCNPPFANMLAWVMKAHIEALEGRRSVVLAPQFGSQGWAHEWARLWTIYVPDRRINYLTPDGTPTDGADRDTSIIVFGWGHENPEPAERFHVLPLEISKCKNS